MVTLILGGIISGALFTALLSIIKYTADPYNQLPAIVYWWMGSLQAVELKRISIVVVPILGGIVGLTLCGRALDALSMGDDEARTLGVPVTVVRYGVIITATLISALSVSIAGIIGWVGLMVPNFARLRIRRGTSAACHKQKPVTAKQQYFLENSELLSRVCWYFVILTMTVFVLHLVKPS